MADNKPRPPVVVEYAISWSAKGASETDTFEINRDEWDAMTPAERSVLCGQIADELVYNSVQWGWNIPDPDDYAATEESK